MTLDRKSGRGIRAAATAVLLGTLGAALAAPVHAQSADAGFRVRAWVGAVGRYVLSDNDTFDSPGFGTVGMKVNGSAFGAGADAEYKFDRWIGLDAALAYSKLNTQLTSSSSPGNVYTQSLTIVPVLVSLNLHVINTAKVDIWVGPQVGYVTYPSNLSYATTSGTFTYDPKNVFSKEGFSAGADIGITRNTLLNLAMRWQDADGDSDGHLTIDPAFVTIGLGWKY